MAKKIKLGKNAQSFYDPTSKLKVLKGQVVEIKNLQNRSKKVQAALRGGHLVYTDEKPTMFMENPEPKVETKNKVDDKDWVKGIELEPSQLKKLKRDELYEVAEYYNGEPLEQRDLTKDQLIELIFELTEDEEDEDEDE